PDLLIDLQSLPKVRGSVRGVPVKKAAAYSFQRPCLFGRCAKLASHGERLGVMASGLFGRRGSQRQLAEAVQRLAQAVPVAQVAEQLDRLGQAGSGGWKVAGQLMHPAELVKSPRLAQAVAEMMEQVQGLVLASDGGRVISGQPPHGAEFTQGVGL